MAALSDAQQKRLNKQNHQWRKLDVAGRIQFLNTDGTFTGGTTGAGVRVTAGSGGITANFFVYVSGYDTTEEQFEVLPADAATAAKARDIFWCPAAITATEFGYAYKQGAITAVNTNAGNVGDPVYLADASAGGWTLTEPTATDRVRQIGTIAVKSSSIGVISVDLGGEAITVHDHLDNAGGGTITIGAGLAGTTETDWNINTGGNQLILDSAGLGQNSTFSFPDTASDEVVCLAASQSLAAKTLTAVTIGATDWASANHAHAAANSGGLIAASGAITGTTSTTFTLDPGTSDGALALQIVGGGSDHTVTIRNTITTAARTYTLPNATGTFVLEGTTATLALKTLTAPVINACTITGAVTITTPTVTGTWTDAGIMTTVDINGGTIDGTVIGGAAALAGSFTTIAAGDDVTIAAGKDVILAQGAGEIKINAATSGGIIIKPTGTTAYDVTLSTITQTTGTATLSIPNMNNVSDTIATLALVNAFTGANTHAGIETFASITGNDAALNITGTAGSGGAGGTLIMAGGAGDTDTAGGLVSTTGGLGNGTGAGGAGSLVGGASGSGAAGNGGAVDLTGGAGQGTGASDGGAATVISGATTNGTAGAVSIDTGAKGSGSAGAMTIAGTNTEALGIGNASCTTTVTGALAMTLDDNITLTSAGTNGYISLGGSVSGGIKLLPLATGTALTTITNQNVAAATITLPSATCTLPGLGLSNTFSVEQTCAIDDANDDVRDALTITHSSSDNGAVAGGGVSLNFDLENAVAFRVEKWASIHAISTDVTDGTEVGDLVLSTMLAGTVSPAVTIDGSEGELVLGQATTLAAGVDRMRIWPVTASRGSLLIVAADNTGDDVVTLTNTNTTAARTLTLPDVTGTLAVIGADQVGYVELSGSVSGAIKVAPIATGTATTTIQNQNISAATITLPSATTTLGGLTLANAHTAVNTYGIADSATNTTVFPVVLNHTSDATEAAAFGVGVDFQLADASNNTQSAGTIGTEWAVATHGSEDADMVFKMAIDNGTVTEVMRLDSTANQLMLGPATGGSKCTGIKVHPVTTAKGSLQLTAVDNNAADVATVLRNGQPAGTATITFPTVSGTVALTSQAAGTTKEKITLMVPGTFLIAGDAKTGGLAGLDQALDLTATEAAAAFCKSYNHDNTKFANLDVTNVQGEWTNAYQLFPDVEVENDACYFGALTPFCELWFDTATAATYNGAAASQIWEYSQGSSTWATLTLKSDSTDVGGATTGQQPFGSDGCVTFVPPADWATDTVDSQATTYWIRCRCTAAVDITQIPTLNSLEHHVVTPTDGCIIPYACNIYGVRVTDGIVGAVHTTADIKFVLFNFTKGTYSLELTFPQDKRTDYWTTTALKAASAGVDCDADDVVGFLCTQADGALELTNAVIELDVTATQ